MNSTIRSTIAGVTLLAIALAGCNAKQGTDQTGRSTAGALDAALRDGDAYARARILGELLPTLRPEAVPDVVNALDALRGELGAAESELLVRFWATHDPEKALEWVYRKSSPLYRVWLAGTVVEIWAEADPPAALAAVESALIESSEEVERVALMALVRGWFRRDRQAAERYIYDLGTGLKRQRSLFAYTLSLVAADGGDAAISWAETIPTDDERYKLAVYRQVMTALAWADMPTAERMCATHCDGPYGMGLRNVLIRTRLRNKEYGGRVVEWAAQTPETDDEQQRANRKHSIWVAFSTWAYRDHEAAMAWMRDKVNEPGEHAPWVRFLYAEYARQLAASSPEEAIVWAERVEDEADRTRTLLRILRTWMKQDSAAAEAWLAKSSLSEEMKAQASRSK